MRISVQSRPVAEAGAELIALPVLQREAEAKRLTGALAALDRMSGGAIRTLLDSGDFGGKVGQSQIVYPDPSGNTQRLLLMGLGEEGKVDAEALRRCAAQAVRRGAEKKAKSVAIAALRSRRLSQEEVACALAEGAILGGYRFEQYKEKKRNGSTNPGRVLLTFANLKSPAAVRAAATRGRIVAESQNLARDLSNEPANILTPQALAQRAQSMARKVGLRSRVFREAELKKMGANAILAVGGGSAHPPRLIVLEHKPSAKKRVPTICLVGKGVTFDSGGISIKPAAGMQDMKHDMSGAAAVVGAMQAIAGLKLPLHVVGVVGAVENLPSATAYRPGDVVRSLSGKTIEVLNTDAEGRVVLSDALHYAKEHYKPDAMVDLATLTGAILVALGPWATGLFSNDDRLSERIEEAGEAASEAVWRMPLTEDHKKAVESHIADLKNTGGRNAGSSTAAAFLAAFVGETPWAHLDIAGTGWTEKSTPCQPKGATGVGVRLLVEMLENWS